ncbi:prepilin-type N-terminal cleavage/methylation domain-containing protein [Candidatus Saccharibacteria bacterium]|nr:MAG: prepilin-type N-terminal cleavage/methylation domain-containing protein [Candidatus Saccharibacteria bacterium]
MTKSKSGFTIVELVVVIVIIVILTTISVVSYSTASARARDSQTATAVNQWVKAIQMYKARNGSFPSMTSCLGTNYKYGVSEADMSGYQCRQSSASAGIVRDSTFSTALSPYMSSEPTPAMQTAIVSSPNDWYRGAYFNPTGGSDSKSVRIDMVISDKGTCPSTIGGYAIVTNTTAPNNFHICSYEIGRQP